MRSRRPNSTPSSSSVNTERLQQLLESCPKATLKGRCEEPTALTAPRVCASNTFLIKEAGEAELFPGGNAGDQPEALVNPMLPPFHCNHCKTFPEEKSVSQICCLKKKKETKIKTKKAPAHNRNHYYPTCTVAHYVKLRMKPSLPPLSLLHLPSPGGCSVLGRSALCPFPVLLQSQHNPLQEFPPRGFQGRRALVSDHGSRNALV